MSTGSDALEWVIEPRVHTLGSRLREIWRYRGLLQFFASRALAKLYQRTVLGRAWLFIRPLFPLLVKTMIFGGLLGVGSAGVPYFLFLVVGTSAWELFAGGLMWATRSLELNRGLITRIYVPRLILPMAMMAPALLTLALHAGVIAAAIGYYRLTTGVLYLQPAQQLLWAPAGYGIALLLALAIGLFTSVLGANVRDVRFTLGYVLDFWFYLTPVVYPASAVSAEWRWLLYLNPMTSVVEMVKFGVLGIGGIYFPGLMVTVATLLTVLGVGLWFFGRAESDAVDRV